MGSEPPIPVSSEATTSVTQDKPQVSDVDSQLIDKIMQKTSEGKVTWERVPSGHVGRTVDGRLSMVLETTQNPIFGWSTWRSFCVRKGNEEILRLENDTGGLLLLAGVHVRPAYQKVAELLMFLETARQREVRAAMSHLDEL